MPSDSITNNLRKAYAEEYDDLIAAQLLRKITNVVQTAPVFEHAEQYVRSIIIVEICEYVQISEMINKFKTAYVEKRLADAANALFKQTKV